jgi:hypothetical protein
MTKLAVTLFVLLFSTGQAFADYDVDLICVSSFDQKVYNLVYENSATCTADFIWGSKGVCYEGNPESLVELMNDEFFNTQSMAVSDAVLNNDGSISYIGYDKMSFWSSKRTISECAE